MHRDADGARLIGNGAGNGLPDPPRCICREFVSLCIVELIDRTDQARVALLDQVQNVQTSAGVFFCDRHDKAQIGLSQAVLGLFIALGDALGQLDFLLGSQQLDLTDLLEVHTHQVIQIVFCSKLQRVYKLFLVVVGNLVHVHTKIVGDVQLQLRADDLDAHRIKSIVNMLDLLDRQIQLFQLGSQLARLNASFALCLCDQRGNRCHCVLSRGLRVLCVCHSFAHPHSSGNIAAHSRNCVIITPTLSF